MKRCVGVCYGACIAVQLANPSANCVVKSTAIFGKACVSFSRFRSKRGSIHIFQEVRRGQIHGALAVARVLKRPGGNRFERIQPLCGDCAFEPLKCINFNGYKERRCGQVDCGTGICRQRKRQLVDCCKRGEPAQLDLTGVLYKCTRWDACNGPKRAIGRMCIVVVAVEHGVTVVAATTTIPQPLCVRRFAHGDQCDERLPHDSAVRIVLDYIGRGAERN